MAIERYNSDPLAGLHAEKMDGHSRTRADHDATLERLLADWVGAI